MSIKKPGLGDNPLDGVMGGVAIPPAASPTPHKARRTVPSAEPAVVQEGAKERTTYHLPVDLVEGIRNAAVHLAGPPEFLTLSAIVERGLRAELECLWKKHNGGKPFSRRPRDLVGGRPIKR